METANPFPPSRIPLLMLKFPPRSIITSYEHHCLIRHLLMELAHEMLSFLFIEKHKDGSS